MQKLKQSILGSPAGRAAYTLREKIDLLRCPAEQLPALLNDQLAIGITTRLCKPGKVFLDLGAHIGSIISEVQRWSPAARVVAVEAIPDKVERLRRKFPNVEIHSCALTEKPGEVSFYIDEEKSGNSSLANSGGTKITVQARPLDDVAASLDIDVIKIDVEGAELGVLIGGANVIAKSRPTIMFESAPEEVLGYTKGGMFDWFATKGYELYLPHRLAHYAPSLSRESFIDSHHYPRRTTNYFAVASERVGEIRAAIPQLRLGSFFHPLVTPPTV